MKMKRQSILAVLMLGLLTIGGCSTHGHGLGNWANGAYGHAGRQNSQQSSHAKQQSRNAGHVRSGRR